MGVQLPGVSSKHPFFISNVRQLISRAVFDGGYATAGDCLPDDLPAYPHGPVPSACRSYRPEKRCCHANGLHRQHAADAGRAALASAPWH